MPRKKKSPQFAPGRKPPHIDLILPGLGVGQGRNRDRFRASGETKDPDVYAARKAMVKDLAQRLLWPLLRARLQGKFSTAEMHDAYRWQPQVGGDGKPLPNQEDRGLEWLLRRNAHSPLAELATTYIATTETLHKDRLRQQIQRFLDFLGPDARPLDFSSAKVAQFLGSLKDDRNGQSTRLENRIDKPATAATKNRYRAALSGFATALVRDGHMDRHPIAFKAVKQFNEGAPKVDDLSPTEWAHYLGAMATRPAEVQLAFKVLAASGADVGEVREKLLVRHCLFDGELPRLWMKRPKVKKSAVRTPPIPRELADEMQAHILAHGLGDNDLVFGMVTSTQLRVAHEAAREAIGRPTLRIKSLRHVAAIYWRRGGADLQTVQERLGHATISQTTVYTAFGTDDAWDAPSTEKASSLLNRVLVAKPAPEQPDAVVEQLSDTMELTEVGAPTTRSE